MSSPRNLSPQNQDEEEEDYINMELAPKNSPPQTKPEFEFQTGPLTPSGKDSAAAFPADDLFYKGQLLPLLLPSRRLMLRHLASPPQLDFTHTPVGGGCHSSLPTNTLNTPSDSRNISPSESGRASCELNPDDYYFTMVRNQKTHTLTSDGDTNGYYHHFGRKKLRLARRYSTLGRKVKAYLKSIFAKPACSDESGSAEGKSLEIANEYTKFERKAKTPTIAGIMKGIDYADRAEDHSSFHRRSFSIAIKRHSPVKCLSSSSSSSSSCSSSVSNNSSCFNGLRRSSSATEIEGSIQAAIAHCKRTCEGFDSGKSDREAGILEFSISRDNGEGDKRTGLRSI